MTGAILAAAGAGVSATGVSGGIATVNSPVTGVIPGSGPCTTSAAIVTTIAGTAPYTYAWSVQLAGAEWTINSPTAASTTFTYTPLIDGDVQNGVFKVLVTDNAAATSLLYVSASARSTSTA